MFNKRLLLLSLIGYDEFDLAKQVVVINSPKRLKPIGMANRWKALGKTAAYGLTMSTIKVMEGEEREPHRKRFKNYTDEEMRSLVGFCPSDIKDVNVELWS